MDFWKVLKSRHCVRSFDSNKPVADEQIEKLINAAKMAPSAGNCQDWEFVVVKEKEKKQQLIEQAISFRQSFVAKAPIVIVVCVDSNKTKDHYGERGHDLYSIQDTAAATQNLLLATTALGLGACWVGAFDENKTREVLNLTDNLRPVVIIPVGYKK
ncbi:MAG: nitroreductase family protein [Patescibacteria group bacterium]|jgi:nitroreductase